MIKWDRLPGILAALLYIFFLFVALRSVLLGGIPFWYDPARDLLLAWDNLHKVSLIGQPGGIPGVFYQPYWIWANSLVLLFTKDPRFAALFVITIPYFVLGPVILYRLRKALGVPLAIALGSLFALAYSSYTTFIWNPYPAPLVFLAIAYLIYTWNPLVLDRKELLRLFSVGALTSLLASLHLSFFTAIMLGIGVLFSVTLVKGVWDGRRNISRFLKNYLSQMAAFLAGILAIFTPFLLFEARHGWNISRSYLHAVIDSTFYNSPVVGQVGMGRAEIIAQFGNVAAQALRLPLPLILGITTLTAIYLLIFRRVRFAVAQWRLFLFLLLSLGSLIFLFASSRNPVWSYYFIGTETVILLLIGLIVSRVRLLTIFLLVWAVFLAVQNAAAIAPELRPKFYLVPSLVSKETTTKYIFQDAGKERFAVFAYNPSIYTFDYDYLFRWLGQMYKSQPVSVSESPDVVYLIIPPDTKVATREDFIHYQTPEGNYFTAWTKTMPDKTQIIKRVPARKA